MRFATSLLLLTWTVTLPVGGWAMGRPEPVECPADVAAALAESCPCDGMMGPDDMAEPWRNHGQYVRCVVKARNHLRKGDCIEKTARRRIARCAARSTCGKPGAVICCLPRTGTCDDPSQGNAVPEGVCSNDGEMACDVDDDCTTGRPKLTRREEACVRRGGTVVGAGSVCDPCTPAVPEP